MTRLPIPSTTIPLLEMVKPTSYVGPQLIASTVSPHCPRSYRVGGIQCYNGLIIFPTRPQPGKGCTDPPHDTPAVIRSHGAYRTVYSNLREVSVAKGQKVDTKQTVGSVLTDDTGSIAHIEVWKITAEGVVKVDPGPWLVR